MFSILIIMILWVNSTRAAESSITTDDYHSVLFKALSHDRNLEDRAGRALNIAIVFQDNLTGEEELMGSIQSAAEKELRHFKITIITIQFESTAQLMGILKEHHINLLYIHQSMERALSSVQQASRGMKIPSVALSLQFIERGVPLGVYELNGKVKLAINFRAEKLEGLDFPATLLKIATIIR